MKESLVVFIPVIFVIFLLSFTSFVYAQPAEYNFGTTQQSNLIQIEPGKTATTKIFFYNIWGNRITHVSLEVAEKPEGWQVQIEPELHNVTLNVTGVIISAEENLFAMPCKIDAEWCPTSELIPREGVEYISGSGVKGKIPAKYALITVTAPPNVPLWTEYTLKITAYANWYGEAGTVALNQARDFSYTIRTVTHEYTEEILPVEEKEKSAVVVWLANNWVYIIIALLLLIITFLIRKTRVRKGR